MLKVTKIPGRGTFEKIYDCRCCSAKWVECKGQYFRILMIDFHIYFIWMSKKSQKYRMFAVFTLDIWQPDKENKT